MRPINDTKPNSTRLRFRDRVPATAANSDNARDVN
jgi:hypothetical protein